MGLIFLVIIKEEISLAFIHVKSIPPTTTVILRKVVGKSARDNPERHCGWF